MVRPVRARASRGRGFPHARGDGPPGELSAHPGPASTSLVTTYRPINPVAPIAITFIEVAPDAAGALDPTHPASRLRNSPAGRMLDGRPRRNVADRVRQ